MHYIVMVEFIRSNVIAQLEPDTVQQVNFFGREMGRMRSKIKNMLLPVGEIDFKGQLGFGIRQSLPCQACNAGFFCHWAIR